MHVCAYARALFSKLSSTRLGKLPDFTGGPRDLSLLGAQSDGQLAILNHTLLEAFWFVPLFRSCAHFVHCCGIQSALPSRLCWENTSGKLACMGRRLRWVGFVGFAVVSWTRSLGQGLTCQNPPFWHGSDEMSSAPSHGKNSCLQHILDPLWSLVITVFGSLWRRHVFWLGTLTAVMWCASVCQAMRESVTKAKHVHPTIAVPPPRAQVVFRTCHESHHKRPALPENTSNARYGTFRYRVKMHDLGVAGLPRH